MEERREEDTYLAFINTETFDSISNMQLRAFDELAVVILIICRWCMIKRRERFIFLWVFCLLTLLAPNIVQAYLITQNDIVATTGNEVQSGNGLMDLLLFADSAAKIDNEYNGYNGDDANTDLPGGSVGSMAEAYITSMKDLRDYYTWAFGYDHVDSIVLYIDMNQTNNNPNLNLTNLSVIIDYDTNFGDNRDDPCTYDVITDLQNATTDGWSWNLGDPSPIGGTVVSRLDSAKILSLNVQGAGWADYSINLGIDPYDPTYTDDTKILVYWESDNHDDGGETMFFSGSYIPEPASLLLLTMGSLSLLRKRR